MNRSFSLVSHAARASLLLLVGVSLGCGSDEAPDTSGADAGIQNDADASGGDTTRPTIIATYPLSAAVDASNTDSISVTFSEPMAAATITGTTFSLKKGAALIPGATTYFDGTATFTPTDALELNTQYLATVSNDATDLAGNSLALAYSWTFTTSASAGAGPAPVRLGTASDYVILAKSAITNVPTSVVTGNLGLSPAAASYITGFALTNQGTRLLSAQVIGGLYAADSDPPTPDNLTTAIGNMQTAYTEAATRPTPDSIDLGTGTIGGLTLSPGLYKWNSNVTIPVDVTIAGGPNDMWIFQVSGDLNLSAATSMILSGGARARNIVWQVAGFVDLGTTSHAEGTILCKTAITLETGASIKGRLLAQTAVNLAGVTVTPPGR